MRVSKLEELLGGVTGNIITTNLFMRRLKCLAVAAVLLSPALTYASDFPWLTFTMNDHTQISVASDNLTMNYVDNNLVLKSTTVDQTIPVAQISSMEFTSSPSGIKDLLAGEGSQSEFYNLSGVKVGKFSSLEEARESLPSGVYILKNDKTTYKVIF